MRENPINLHPEAGRIQQDISLLREDLAVLLTKLHDLEHIIKPNLLAIFQTKLGPWELRVLEAQCKAARWKRKSELIQASLNRGELPDFDSIESTLNREFLTWQQRIRESVQKIESAQFRLSHLISTEDNALLKKLFYTLAKKLHPDVNPNHSPEQQSLWLKVLYAYQTCDIEKLKALELAQGDSTDSESPGGIEALRTERERLLAHLQSMRQKIDDIRKQNPFSMQTHWEDDLWIEQRRAELEAAEALAKSSAAKLEKHVEALLIVYGKGQNTGLN